MVPVDVSFSLLMCCNEHILRLKFWWKLTCHLGLWIYLVLISFCHLLGLCHSFKVCALPLPSYFSSLCGGHCLGAQRFREQKRKSVFFGCHRQGRQKLGVPRELPLGQYRPSSPREFILVCSEAKVKDFPVGWDCNWSACNAGEQGSLPGWGRSPAEGNG